MTSYTLNPKRRVPTLSGNMGRFLERTKSTIYRRHHHEESPRFVIDPLIRAVVEDAGESRAGSGEGSRLGEAPGLSEGPRLTRYQEEALRIAERRGEVRRRDLIERFGISRETARRELVGLVELGLLSHAGSGRGSHYVPTGRPAPER